MTKRTSNDLLCFESLGSSTSIPNIHVSTLSEHLPSITRFSTSLFSSFPSKKINEVISPKIKKKNWKMYVLVLKLHPIGK